MTEIEIITPLQTHEFSDSWYEISNQAHFWFKWRFEAFLRQLNDLKISLEINWKVLDAGCGCGVLREQLETATAWTVDAIDLDYEALKQVSDGRGRIMYYDLNEKKNEFKEKYDAIILFDVLEHIENQLPFIESVLFHLKKGGFLFVNVPALQSLYSRYDKAVGHFRRYHKRNLSEQFVHFPISTKDVRFWGLINVPVLLFRKCLLALTGKNKSNAEIIQSGFSPSNIVNKSFMVLMKIEISLIPSPFIGSSVLWIGKKNDG